MTDETRTGGQERISVGNQPVRPNDRRPPQGGDNGFDTNRPSIISLLYLASFLTGITGLVGIVLAHVWQGERENEAWMESHFTYLIRTFWIGFVASIVAAVLSVILIGLLLFPVIAIWFGARSVMSLMKAQKREPMPDPATLLF